MATLQSEKQQVPRPQRCSECPFKTDTTADRGNPDAELVFVGESPGAQELARNAPFVGPSGIVLNAAFNNRLKPEDCLVTNAIQCYPIKTKDKDKTQEALLKACNSCKNILVEKLTKKRRRVIVALGNPALWSLTGNSKLRITQERGKVFSSPYADYLIPTVHPAFLLRGGGSWHKFFDDIQYAIDLYKGLPTREYIEPSWIEWTEDNWEQRLQHYIDKVTKNDGPLDLGADIETTGLHHIKDSIINIGIAYKPTLVDIIPQTLIHKMLPLFELGSDKVKWIWQNGKFDVKFLRHMGIPARVDEDTMLLNYSLDEQRGHHDLDQIAKDLLAAPDHKGMLDQYLPNKSASYSLVPSYILNEYLAKDLAKTIQIFPILKRRNNEDAACKKHYNELLLPASNLLMHVEERGMYIDSHKIAENQVYYIGENGEGGLKGKIQNELNTLAIELGYQPVNANSPQQVQKFLYGFLKLGSIELDTGADTLEKLPEHPAVAKILEFREASKAYGTYVKPYPDLMTNANRIHSTYLLHGTPTGRLASRDPNVQNIPRSPRLRGQISATPGFILLDKDYDQAELRCLADRSGDKELCRIYNTPGLSIHKEVSVSQYGQRWADIYLDPGHEERKTPEWLECKEQYMRAKALNFGIVYGRTAISIAMEFDISKAEAQKMIDGWAERFPEAWAFITACRMAPVRGQNLITPFGNRKRAQLTSMENLTSLQNEAANFPHQSIASHSTLMSAVRLQPTLSSLGVHIINLIHDSILCEIPIVYEFKKVEVSKDKYEWQFESDEDSKLIERVEKEMDMVMRQVPIDYGLTKVPFLTDGKIGTHWGQLS